MIFMATVACQYIPIDFTKKISKNSLVSMSDMASGLEQSRDFFHLMTDVQKWENLNTLNFDNLRQDMPLV